MYAPKKKTNLTAAEVVSTISARLHRCFYHEAMGYTKPCITGYGSPYHAYNLNIAMKRNMLRVC
ncbi:hypothetical protein FKP32DRAFT_302918 [Trametes sanguinea]|nr:hypothetical protein FKP32DRAFT_302918 [Trametes sanguinea]